MLQLFSVAVTRLAEIGTYVLVFVFPAVLSSLSCETSLQTALKCTSFFSLKKKKVTSFLQGGVCTDDVSA